MSQTRGHLEQPIVAMTNWTPRSLHVLFIVVYSVLFVLAIVFVCLGGASSSQTFDSGPMTHDAQAGVDYLIAGFLGSTALVVLMIHAGVRLLELAVTRSPGDRDA